MKNFFVLFLIVFINFTPINVLASDRPITQTSLNLYDKSRNRIIPVEIYFKNSKINDNKIHRVVIINHGYGVSNKEYSFIAKRLAESDYFVASIQHDLIGDPKLPVTGSIFERRKPMWNKGVQNIEFVISELKKFNPALDLKKVILIGHSNRSFEWW